MRRDFIFPGHRVNAAAAAATLAMLAAIACDDRGGRNGDGDDGDTAVAAQSLAALPALALDPVDNPRSEAKVELGRLLFWDPVLSGGRDVACATCHHPDSLIPTAAPCRSAWQVRDWAPRDVHGRARRT